VPAAVAPAPQPELAQTATVPAPVAALPAFAPVPAGLPSDLLLRRPDIRAAEQQLIGANANIGAARANFFPRITLTASLGRVSTDLDGLLGSHGFGAWSFAPALTCRSSTAAATRPTWRPPRPARHRRGAVRKAIQGAFREVADALAGRATLAAQLTPCRLRPRPSASATA
jgi:multidrug efflux system outer membrane protein